MGTALIVIAAVILAALKAGVRPRNVYAFFTSTPKPGGPDEPASGLMESKLAQRLLGLALVGTAGYFLFDMWANKTKGNEPDSFLAVVFPIVGVFGLALVVFPFDVDEQFRKYRVSRPRTWGETPRPMKVASVLAVVAGVGNLVALVVFSPD